MQKHPMIEELIEAQLNFLDHTFSQSPTVDTEFVHFYQWFRKATAATALVFRTNSMP